MYPAQSSGVDGATINPAALNSDLTKPSSRGMKRSRSPDTYDSHRPGNDSEPLDQYPTKRVRSMKARSSGSISEAPGHAPGPVLPPQAVPPPQAHQPHNPSRPTQPTPAYAAPHTRMPPKATPTKSTLKALPTVRDHTTDQLNSAGDEYIPRETDELGEKKIQPNGQLLGGRQYRCRVFLVINRGDILFMLATELARLLGYRDSYLLFNKNRSLFKIIASQAEKDDLVSQEILPFSYRSRQIAIVTAHSMFRQFGSRVIENGHRCIDDYWEIKARKQGFTEEDPAGEKRPGAAKAREAAEAAQTTALMGSSHSEIVYSSTPGPYPGAPAHLVAGIIAAPPGSATRMPALSIGPDLNDNRPREYGGIVKSGPRQEITGPPYQDQTRPTAIGELHSQAHHAADFNRSVNQQRDIRGDYVQTMWRRPHEQPPSSSLTQPVGSSDTTLPSATRPSSSPHTSAAGIPQPGVVSSQSPQMMITGPPYSQSISAQSTLGQAPIRGMAPSHPQPSTKKPMPTLPGSTGSMSTAPSSYSYQQNPAIWSQSQQPAHNSYASYTTQAQPTHPSQSPVSHLRQPSSSQLPSNLQFPGMSSMQYGTGQGMYSTDQTPRQYMTQNPSTAPSGSQTWSAQQHAQQTQQWWPHQPGP